MEMTEVIRTRRSVRTFDGRPLTQEDTDKLRAYIETVRNPYGIPVQIVLLDAETYGLSSPVLTGEHMYAAGKVDRVPHAEEAFGYSFEKLVLYAWSMGIGTTWIGGTMKRESFEKAAALGEGQMMPCVSPLGYPSEKMSVRETLMRRGAKVTARKPWSERFFDKSFSEPLVENNQAIAEALEMVRLAPSAVNRQPWRVVREGTAYHFYLRHDRGYISKAVGDLQKVDMGIALCHFMSMAEGEFEIRNPGIHSGPDTEYIATVIVRR